VDLIRSLGPNPLCCASAASDYSMQLYGDFAPCCRQSYFARGNIYELLVTTNDAQIMEIRKRASSEIYFLTNPN
jgi:hypothetical protein